MAFFPDDAVVKKTTPTSHDYVFADRLRALVTGKASHVRRWRRTTWANEFRILRQELTPTPTQNVEDRIGSVVDWYTRNYGKPGTPELLSATAFRKHFDWLERLSKKEVKQQRTDSEEVITASAALYSSLRGRQWGKGTGNLEESILRSVRRRAWLVSLLGRHKDHNQIGPFLRWVWGRLAGDTFLRNWYDDLWNQVRSWEGWSGSFVGLEFSPDGKAFRAKMSGWAAEYGDSRFWDRVCEVVPGVKLNTEEQT
jgi:hypothetical protein